MPSEAAIVDRMQSLISQWETASNPQAVFLRCYQMMTSNMLAAIDQGEFQDPVWVSQLLHHFAHYYFVALEAYEQDPVAPPLVWQVAHDKTRDLQALPLQNLLLGINAHINYDLVFTLVDLLEAEWSNLSAEQRTVRYADYCHVNEVLSRTVDSVQDQVLEPAMPGMSLLDLLMGPLDELLVSRLITAWRETVWQSACRLLDTLADDERASLQWQVEEDAFQVARLVCPFDPTLAARDRD